MSGGAFPKWVMHDTEEPATEQIFITFWHLQCWAADDSILTSYGTMASVLYHGRKMSNMCLSHGESQASCRANGIVVGFSTQVSDW